MIRVCEDCGGRLPEGVAMCLTCRCAVGECEPERGRVLAATEVWVPSVGHEDVPYWCALVETPEGATVVHKSETEVAEGDEVPLAAFEAAEALTVGVVGSGVMGRGLVELLLTKGHDVVWTGRSQERLERASEKVADRLGRIMDEDQVTAAMRRLTPSQDKVALRDCDVVIEAVVEDLGEKSAALQDAEEHMSDEAVLCTNTSSLPIDDLSLGLRRPARFGGLHFFNPPTRMRLVETSVGERSDEATSRFLDAFAAGLGKVPVRVAAAPGFVVNRCLMPLLNEAVRAFEDEVASAADIDEAVRLGLNHPMGPLALADLIGLDVVVSIMEDLSSRLDDPGYEPRPTLRAMVAEGRLGRKAGQGFYDYRQDPGVR